MSYIPATLSFYQEHSTVLPLTPVINEYWYVTPDIALIRLVLVDFINVMFSNDVVSFGNFYSIDLD